MKTAIANAATGFSPTQFKPAIQCQRDEHDSEQVGTSQSLETVSGQSAAVEKPGATLFHHAEQCHDHKGNGCENGSAYTKFRSTLKDQIGRRFITDVFGQHEKSNAYNSGSTVASGRWTSAPGGDLTHSRERTEGDHQSCVSHFPSLKPAQLVAHWLRPGAPKFRGRRLRRRQSARQQVPLGQGRLGSGGKKRCSGC